MIKSICALILLALMCLSVFGWLVMGVLMGIGVIYNMLCFIGEGMSWLLSGY